MGANDAIHGEWLRDFEAAARRLLEQRLNYSFIKTYKPVLDDAPFRAFSTMDEYRRWCKASLPAPRGARSGLRPRTSRSALTGGWGPASPGLPSWLGYSRAL
jgi:hypothetical protein